MLIDGDVVDVVSVLGMVRISSSVVVDTFDTHEEDCEGAYDDGEVRATFVQTVEFEGSKDLFQ